MLETGQTRCGHRLTETWEIYSDYLQPAHNGFLIDFFLKDGSFVSE